MCGEKEMRDITVSEYQGSPPHVRGKDTPVSLCSLALGITPACAGKSAGQNPMGLIQQGSPPHVRGKDTQGGVDDFAERITPACAGKRGRYRLEVRSAWDHPRMCGEKA